MSKLDNEIRELERKKQELARRRYEEQERERKAVEAAISASGVPRIGWSDDYICFTAGGLSFYFGYEVTKRGDWCFQCKRGKRVIAQYRGSELSTATYDRLELHLIAGIGLMLNKGLLQECPKPPQEQANPVSGDPPVA